MENGEGPPRGQSAPLRITLGIVLLMLGITKFVPSQQEAITAIYETALPFLKKYLTFASFSTGLGAAEVGFAIWLWSGKWSRLAGFAAIIFGIVTLSFLFTLKENAWHLFPFVLSTKTGASYIKNLLIAGIGIFLLFEKR